MNRKKVIAKLIAELLMGKLPYNNGKPDHSLWAAMFNLTVKEVELAHSRANGLEF
jgi:hypothetical protein